ncbi:MAG: hypothetical protein FWD78_10415 [Treponema sp.]|nr:hypothetical protein [Treponema sp.]
MELKKLICQRLPRIKAFWNSPAGALINVTSVTSFKGKKARPLLEWNFPADLYQYLDTIIEDAGLHWMQRDEIDDDLLPSVQPWFGIAEHSAIMGGDIHFSDITSFQIPFVTDWDRLDSIELSQDNKWFKILMDSFCYLKEKAKGRFLVRLRGGESPMDMANAIRGNEIFSDLYDYPDEVKKLFGICEKGLLWYFENQKKYSDFLDGGWISGYNVWMPGNSAGHLSEDATVMCSPQMYREFGRPFTAHFCAGHDNVLIHLHGAGRHAFEEIVSIPQFTVIELTNDPKQPGGMELFREYENIFKNKIVMLHLTKKEFDDNRDFLKSKKIIIDYAAASVEDAKTMIKSVREL